MGANDRTWTRHLIGPGACCLMVMALLAMARSAPGAEVVIPSPSCRLTGGVTGTVARVVDGETVELSGGETVRLIGSLAPAAPLSATGKRAWPPARAAAAGLSELVLGRRVAVRFAGTRKDRRGRLFGHLFVTGSTPPRWIQGEMVARGLARAYSLRGNSACLPDLLKLEARARQLRRGLWAHPRYRIVAADAVRRLGGMVNKFQLVEGRVKKVAVLSRRTYLNFGADWRRDFTVSVERKHRGRFAAGGVDLAGLEGRRVRVRGWVRWINGPAIVVTHPGQIEIIRAK